MINRKSLVFILGLWITSGFAFTQTLPSYSSKLLIPKIFTRQLLPFPIGYREYNRMNAVNSVERFEGDEIFGTPYGICSYVYNDPAYTDGTDTEFLLVSDQGWDRIILHGLKGTIGGDDNQFIEARGQNGTAAVSYRFNSPRAVVGDDRNFYVSDTYNNRVHVYEFNPEVPQDTTNFRGFDSLAIAYAGDTPTPLRTPLGIDKIVIRNQDGSFFDKQVAVADYGNNRVVIYEDGFNGFGNTPGRSYGQPGLNPLLDFRNPTAVAYGWDKATGRQTHELYVISQGNGDIYWVRLNSATGGPPTVEAVLKCDFDQLVADSQALLNCRAPLKIWAGLIV